jgi:integral membrane sensor domain MASE1
MDLWPNAAMENKGEQAASSVYRIYDREHGRIIRMCLANHSVGRKNVRFDRIKEILALLIGTIFVNAISACIGAGSGVLLQGANFLKSWLSWYVADGLGILLITPVIVCWMKVREFIPQSGKGWILKSGLFIAVWSAAAWQALQPGNFSRTDSIHP